MTFLVKMATMVKEKLLEQRLKKGFSQEEMADLIGISQSNYCRKEKGLTKISDSEWELIAEKLEIRKEAIFEEDDFESVANKKNQRSSDTFDNKPFLEIPDFALEYIEILKTQNQKLKEENKILKSRLIDLKKPPRQP